MSRRQIVERVVHGQWTYQQAADGSGVSQRTVAKWAQRFRVASVTGLEIIPVRLLVASYADHERLRTSTNSSSGSQACVNDRTVSIAWNSSERFFEHLVRALKRYRCNDRPEHLSTG
jgi:hypothetical protein